MRTLGERPSPPPHVKAGGAGGEGGMADIISALKNIRLCVTHVRWEHHVYTEPEFLNF
jgi:hypothetical protein